MAEQVSIVPHGVLGHAKYGTNHDENVGNVENHDVLTPYTRERERLFTG